MKETDALNTNRNACIKKITQNTFGSGMSDEDWFNLGKSDAWAKQPKVPPEHDSQAASMYDLGYSEGEIKHPPIENRAADQ